MSEARLAPAIEASALLARIQSEGGFGMLLHRGDNNWQASCNPLVAGNVLWVTRPAFAAELDVCGNGAH